MKEKILNYIYNWEKKCYNSGIPDEAPIILEQLDLVPSYRRIAIAIMKNDINLESIGFSRPYNKTYDQIKRGELIRSGKIKKSNQLTLW